LNDETDRTPDAPAEPPLPEEVQPFPNLQEDLADADAQVGQINAPAEVDDAPTPAPAPAEAAPSDEHALQAMAGSGYRIALDAYCGPLDLLLYLIRKNEVDIYDIPVAMVAEQYQKYLEAMADINVNVAGEFLVMAATLMEIKSRMLLPTEEALEDDEDDPRAELVRQLLEYKKYKDIARDLGGRAAEQALKFPRPEAMTGVETKAPGDEAADGSPDFLDGIGLWELIDAFAKVLSETSLITGPQTQVLEHERPLHEYRRDLLRILTTERNVTFAHVFMQCRTRDDMIAMFIALLELVRLKRVGLQQPGSFGEIYMHLAEDPEAKRLSAAEAAAHQERQAPAGHEEKRPPDISRPAPVEVADQADALKDDEETAAYVRAQGRADDAIKQIESFLKGHHDQSQEGEPEAAAETPADEPAPEGQAAPKSDAPAEAGAPEPPPEAEASVAEPAADAPPAELEQPEADVSLADGDEPTPGPQPTVPENETTQGEHPHA
jgi:segregation and condensation protein A